MTDKVQNTLSKLAKMDYISASTADKSMVNGALIGTGIGGIAGGLLGYLSSRERESFARKIGKTLLGGLLGAGTGFVGGAFGGPYFVDKLYGFTHIKK